MSLWQCRAELAGDWVELVDSTIIERGDDRWSLFEDVRAGRAWLIGVFPDESAARAGWRELRPQLPRGVLRPPEWRELAEVDWRESYKAHFKAWHCGRLHWVPEWERATYRLTRGQVAVYLDPGLAFGTGNHETTRLCCRRLVDVACGLTPRARRTWRVIDAGCGSGILAISAAKLGCRQIFAFDNDPEAAAIARENTRRNRVASVVRISTGGLAEQLRRRQADLVLANIQADVLVANAEDLLRAVAPGGQLVLSGILASERPMVRERFAVVRAGARLHSRTLGEWADLRISVPATKNKKGGPPRGRL